MYAAAFGSLLSAAGDIGICETSPRNFNNAVLHIQRLSRQVPRGRYGHRVFFRAKYEARSRSPKTSPL